VTTSAVQRKKTKRRAHSEGPQNQQGDWWRNMWSELRKKGGVGPSSQSTNMEKEENIHRQEEVTFP